MAGSDASWASELHEWLLAGGANPAKARPKSGTNGTKEFLFFKNEPERLLKTKDRAKKRTETNPKTNRAMLLKTKDDENRPNPADEVRIHPPDSARGYIERPIIRNFR